MAISARGKSDALGGLLPFLAIVLVLGSAVVLASLLGDREPAAQPMRQRISVSVAREPQGSEAPVVLLYLVDSAEEAEAVVRAEGELVAAAMLPDAAKPPRSFGVLIVDSLEKAQYANWHAAESSRELALAGTFFEVVDLRGP